MSAARVLRADPSRVRVTIRAPRAGSGRWEAWVMPIGGGKMAFALECTPEAAVEKALYRAARIQMPGVDLDGAVWADPSGPRARVEP